MKSKRAMPPVVAVLAKDWSLYGEQYDFEHEFDLITGWIAGLLVSEDDEKIVIAHQWFPSDDQVRKTSAIPKSNIVERLDYEPAAGQQESQEAP